MNTPYLTSGLGRIVGPNVYMKRSYKYSIVALLFVALLFVALLFIPEFQENATKRTRTRTRTLENDGLTILYDPQYNQTTDFPCNKLKNDVLAKLPPGYVIMDYTYKIEGGALSTFHRDVTSSKNIYKTKHPVFTLILYKYGGELLSVCPGSNQTYPFVWSNIVNISGAPGTAFLFDCDLLHAGCQNECRERVVFQYKVCHKDDLGKLGHLQGVRAQKREECRMSMYSRVMRKLSYMFEFPVNYLLYPLMIKRENADTLVGQIQAWIPISYYNNV